MIFTTLKFMVFFSIVFLVYYMMPKKWQWKWLLLASYVFYMSASPLYVIFLVFTTLVTYFGANAMSNYNEQQKIYLKEHKELSREDKKEYGNIIQKKKKRILIAVILCTIGLVIVLKYSMFVLQNIQGLFFLLGKSITVPTLKWILPIGLSFYVFQSLGYCIDVYWEMYLSEKNLGKHALFVSYFPQILQGPIGEYQKMSVTLYEEKTFDYERTVQGALRVAWGFFKKLVIADNIAVIVNPVFQLTAVSTGKVVFIALLLYSIELYADFSGYMDIAIGCSKMLGIELAENFDTPYFSKNITEFWRRWHISLGTWFKNYVFYPMLRSNLCTGLRKKHKKNKYLASMLPNVIALAVVWLLIGLWHGADWCYVLYGIYHGTFIILAVIMAPLYDKFYEKFTKLKTSKIYHFLCMIRTFLIVTVGYILFVPGSFQSTLIIIKNICSSHLGQGINIMNTLSISPKIILSTIVLFGVDVISLKYNPIALVRKLPFVIRMAGYLAFIFFIIAFMQTEASEFLYFQF